MAKIVYHIVEHDDGWAYQVDGVFSETFPSHDAARRAAQRGAAKPADGAPKWKSADYYVEEILAGI